MRAAALLHAALQQPFAAFRGFGQRFALVPAMQSGLFQIEVLVGSQRVLGNLHVQVIGRGDVDCIDVLAVEHLLVLDRDLGVGHVVFEATLKGGYLLVVDVASARISTRGSCAKARHTSVARRPGPMTPRPTRSLAPANRGVGAGVHAAR